MLHAGCSAETTIMTEGCRSCHEPADRPADHLEIAHASVALTCTDCHGGRSEGRTITEAHVLRPAEVAGLRASSRDEVAQLEKAYLQFVNPSHPIAAPAGCGSGSPQSPGFAGCHQSVVDRSRFSVHATNVGLTMIPRFDANLINLRPPTVGVIGVTNDSFQPSIAPRFTYRGLSALPLPDLREATVSDPRPLLDLTLSKACTGCHLSIAGAVDETTAHRGTGCASCHVPYAADGVTLSKDPLIERTPGHLERHEIGRTPADAACERCHATSARIGPSFRGWREKGASDAPGVALSEQPGFNRPAGAYVVDEDPTNRFDETPPDVHQGAGMICSDCHFGRDVHGTGHIEANMGRETGIECEDCHGTFDNPATTDESGAFRSSGGDPLTRLQVEGGRVVFKSADGVTREVVQVSEVGGNENFVGSHDSASHAELECYACHNGWMQNYYRVDRILDLRAASRSPLDGAQSPGRVTDVNQVVAVDRLHLGINVDGRVGTFMVRNELLTVLAPCQLDEPGCELPEGELIPRRVWIEGWFGRSSEQRPGLSWSPVFQHTVPDSSRARACSACHPTASGANLAQVRGVYGFGTGEFFATHPITQERVDLTRMIGPAGTSSVAIGTLLAKPIPFERIQRALAVQAPR